MVRLFKSLAMVLAFTAIATPADSRVFTTPGWYLVYYDDYSMEEFTGAGPYNSKEQCDANSDAVAEADEWYMFADDYACLYLSQAMANDN